MRFGTTKCHLRRAAACATVVLLTVEPGIAQAACLPTPEQASIGIRALQTELMVAGLKCSAEKFNAFTGQFKATIKLNADRMQALFRKTYGQQAGATRMNAFVTQLANDASQRSNTAAEVDYCRQEDEVFKQVLMLTGAELERFSAKRSLTVAAPVSLCDAEPEPVVPVVNAAAPPPSPAPQAKRKAARQ